MKDETIEVETSSPSDQRSTLRLRLQEGELCRITVVGGGEVLEYVASDFFSALIELRRPLDRRATKLLCAGARIDVYPSAMSRDMSRGRKAYVTRQGQRTAREDLVSIFDPASASRVGTIEEQAYFHATWLKSVR
jgi:hypothetical protein